MKKAILAILIALFLTSISAVFAATPAFNPSLASKDVNVGETLYYDINAVDPDANDTITFSDNTPKFNIDSSTGIINWPPTNADAGTFDVNITATDGTNSVTDKFQIHVNRKPVLTSFPLLAFNEDTPNSSIDLDNYATDFDNDTIAWSFSGNSHISVSISQEKVVTFTPALNWNGNEVITFTASDAYSSVQQAINITVNAVNDAPVYSEMPTQHITQGDGKDINLMGYFNDPEGDSITFTIYSQPEYTTATIEGDILTLDSDSGWIGEDSMRITASDGKQNYTTGSIKIVIGPDLCEEGIIGNLSIRVDEPDGGDEFYPGDTIKVEAEVKNEYTKDMYVIVEAVLYNIDEDDEIKSVKSDKKKIDHGDNADFDIDFEVPSSSSLDEDDEYLLYIKAYKADNEDDHCVYDSREADIEREDHKVVVDSISLSPSEQLKCGEEFTLTAKVKNLGSEAEEDSYVYLYSPKLSIKEYSQKFDLEEYDSSKDTYTVSFDLKVPGVVDQGDYYIYTAAYFDGGDEIDEETAKVTIACKEETEQGTQTSPAKGINKVSVKPPADKITVKAGRKTFALPLAIYNNGSNVINPTISITGIDLWAKVTSLEAPKVLLPGKESHAYAYFVLKDGVAEGAHDLTVEILSGETSIASATASVTLEGGTIQEEQPKDKVTALTIADLTSKKSFWVVLDIFLIVFAIWLIKVLFGR